MERVQKHHFGTQPFWHRFGTQNATYHQTTANKTDVRFTDRRSTLEASRVPKRSLYKKKPMRNVAFRSMSPSATPATQNEGRCHQVPRLPHNMDVDVTKCHACHTNRTLPILTVTMLLPLRLLGAWGGGLGLTTLHCSGC